MKKEFVTLEIAKKLKDLGFNEPCFTYFRNSTSDLFFMLNGHNEVSNCYNKEFGLSCTAPTWFNAINWVRKTYGIHIHIEWREDNTFCSVVTGEMIEDFDDGIYQTTITEAYICGFNDFFKFIDKHENN